MATNSDVAGAQLEVVRPKLQELYLTDDKIWAMVKKSSESHRVSTFQSTDGTVKAFRVPLMKYLGGDYATYSMDEGDMGSGSSLKVTYMSYAYFPTRLAFQISDLEAEATASSEQSVVNVTRRTLKDAILEMQHYADTDFFGDSTGILATANGSGSPSTTNPVFSLEANFGPQRLRYGQPVDLYTSALSTKRTNSTQPRVTAIDFINKTVTLTGVVNATANTDVIAYSGMSVTLAAGSWRNGLYTFNNVATSGTTGGLDRAVETEIVSPNVNAGGNGLVPAYFQLLADQRIQRRDESKLAGTIGIWHMAQAAAYKNLGVVISNWQRGQKDKMIDILPTSGPNETIEVGGIVHYIAKKADRSRIDYVQPKNWGRINLFDMKFHEVEGRRIFELRSSSTGNVKAGTVFYLKNSDQVYNVDPGSGGVIYGLALPSGY